MDWRSPFWPAHGRYGPGSSADDGTIFDIGWTRLVVGAALFMAVGSLGMPLEGRVGSALLVAVNVALSIASLPFLLVALSGLFGDRATPWRDLLQRGWRAIGLLLVLLLSGFGVLQAIHAGNHMLALGRPTVVIWMLMIWDTLVVGLLAATTGAALALSYRLAREHAGQRPATGA